MNREELLAQPLVAVFAVARPDGRVHATPLWFYWDGRDINLIVERASRRHRWAVTAGRAAICIETVEGDALSFVTAEGPIRVVDPLEKATRFLVWERYRGEAKAREVVDRGGHETKVLMLLRPERWIPA
jgi:hypothetical protein